jgi:NitT/TauT family transport system ATP-binding protein
MPENDPEIALRVTNVSLSFGGINVLKSVSFCVKRGEFAVLMGPNGCGKTTLLRVVAGVQAQGGGDVAIAPAGGSRSRRDLAMVFQKPLLLPWLSVEDNIRLPLAVNRSAGTPDELSDLLKLAGLEDRRKSTPDQLSGGERQKVAILRALVQDPSVLVLDEPFSALDPVAHTHLQDYLLSIWALRKMTIVFVTHDIEEAAYLGDRVLVLTRKPSVVKDDITIGLPRPRPHADDPGREAIVLGLRRALVGVKS